MSDTEKPYLDESGKPRLRESVTAFLDVLGFSQTVSVAAKLGRSQQFLDDLLRALNEARAFARESVADEALAAPRNWAIKLFSDNILFGCPCDVDGPAAAAAFVVRCTQRYQLQMALSGFFVRGGLALGPLCLTEDIIFGTALLESYKLESKASIVPRVVLAEPVLEAILASYRTQQGQAPKDRSPDPLGELLCRDIDGCWFVNYLQAAVEPAGVNWKRLEQHKQKVMASLSQSVHHDVLPKFGWVSRYHNVFCHWHRHAPGYSDQIKVKWIDEDSPIRRMRDAALD